MSRKYVSLLFFALFAAATAVSAQQNPTNASLVSTVDYKLYFVNVNNNTYPICMNMPFFFPKSLADISPTPQVLSIVTCNQTSFNNKTSVVVNAFLDRPINITERMVDTLVHLNFVPCGAVIVSINNNKLGTVHSCAFGTPALCC